MEEKSFVLPGEEPVSPITLNNESPKFNPTVQLDNAFSQIISDHSPLLVKKLHVRTESIASLEKRLIKSKVDTGLSKVDLGLSSKKKK